MVGHVALNDVHVCTASKLFCQLCIHGAFVPHQADDDVLSIFGQGVNEFELAVSVLTVPLAYRHTPIPLPAPVIRYDGIVCSLYSDVDTTWYNVDSYQPSGTINRDMLRMKC